MGYIDHSGRWVIRPQYTDAGMFAEGLAPVQTLGRWGFISPRSVVVIAAQFDEALPFRNGLAWVLRDGRWGYVDRNGKMVWEEGSVL